MTSHMFSQIPKAEIQRSSFDRSSGVKTTFDAGNLIPFFCDEVLPGDTFNLRTSGFARLATPLAPVMDNMYLDTFYFFVPNRLIWDNFQRFMGEQTDPGDSTDYLVPTLNNFDVPPNSLFDHFGLPVDKIISPNIVSALPFRAYNLIYNEWFRDQNLQDSVDVPRDDGPDLGSNYNILRRGKRHDYFTSALPWPQKGPSVDIPIVSSNAPIMGTGAIGDEVNVLDAAGGGNFNFNDPSGELQQFHSKQGGPVNLFADMSSSTAATINQLRQAFQVQKMFERDARGGTRYTELIRSHFGVISPDARLQRPEFLGGGSSPIHINPLASTAETSERDLGSLGGVGTTAFSGHGFSKSFTEHGFVIGMCSVRADLTYQQGLNRMFTRRTRFDYYWPSFAHLGEQEILNREIFMIGAGGESTDEAVFGYQERYAEYRYKPSEIHGLFRSDVPQSLDYWHLSQDFENTPVLGPEFIEDNPPIDRIVAVPSEPHFIADFHHSLRCARPMPLYGEPGNIDRF
ncbi:major capsid protein [Microviridae sp.]|nr:major capsid protein [Microviridae sp.]